MSIKVVFHSVNFLSMEIFLLKFEKKLFRQYLNNFIENISSVIRQKGEYQKGGNKKVKHAKFSEKPTFLKGVWKVRFSENLACFAFLLPRFWDSPFYPTTDNFLKSHLPFHRCLMGISRLFWEVVSVIHLLWWWYLLSLLLLIYFNKSN